jgi:nitrate reductase gamma subunit
MTSFLWFVEQPLWYLAATIFIAGVLWRLFALVALGHKEDLSVPRGSGSGGALRALLLHFIPHGGFLSKTVFHVLAGYAFHIGFFVLLLFAAPHVVFIEERILGVGWTPLPRWGFILAAEFAFAGLIFLWARRISDPVQRQISDADDQAGAWLTFLAMLTGCLALAESSVVLRSIHMLTVEAWLIYFPFSRLMHAFTWAFSRSYMGAVFGRRGVTP